jgi:hypothetical protein
MTTIMYASTISSVRDVARTSRSVVRASAEPKAVKAPVSRRDTLALGASAVQFMVASKAWALIPGNDDEDEECVPFSTANAASTRIERESNPVEIPRSSPRLVTRIAFPQNADDPRSFIRLRSVRKKTRRLLAKAKANRNERIQAERKLEKTYVTTNELKLDSDTSKVQVAVFKLSKAGGLIESGYLALAAEELSKGAWEADLKAAQLGKEPDAFLSAVADLTTACTSGDAGSAKKKYVVAAKALSAFAKDTNTADALKLL